ncbi:TIGR04219 family outer membrane beta-barrel protein [Marinobacteraceae bacterium S3BR75-40.1]
MKRLLTFTSLLAIGAYSVPASADVIGASASATLWPGSISGQVRKDGDRVDLEDDLGLDDETYWSLEAAIEHPVPVLPNLRLAYYNMEHSGTGNTSVANFGGISLNGDVETDLDLSHYDVTLYYELLDNWVNLDAGLTGKVFNGELVVRDKTTGQTDRTDIDAILPMIYGHARFDLPFTGWSVGVQGNGISFDGDSAYDIAGYVNYSVTVLDVQAGFREMAVDAEDINDADVDATVNGPYLKVGVDF